MVCAALLTLLPGPRAWAQTSGGLDAVSAIQTAATVASDGTAAAPAPAQAAAAPADDKGPPLPFQTIEGYGGGGITPFAYLVNPGPEECLWGKPATALTYIDARQKDLFAVTASETLFGRLELSYGGDRLGLGTLPADIAAFGQRNHIPNFGIEEDSVWLQNFNFRALLWKENDCLLGIKAPAITAGVSLKFNSDISNINRELDNALSGIGYRRDDGVDFTLTATKTFPKLLLDRPVIVTTGLRLSEAADLGFLGFGDTYRATFEGNVAWLPYDKVLVAYEFRQNADPYGKIANGIGGYLIGAEDNWQAFDLALIVNKHSTLVAGWALLGNLANAEANNTWFLQYKYEF
jgi:hypothetical protein